MNPNITPEEEVEEMMQLWSKGLTYAEIGAKVGRTVRSVESIVARRRGNWTRAFNFPHIIHAKRFGAK
jgi:DNA-directed RNA polymerase specialized sigma24 family protein